MKLVSTHVKNSQQAYDILEEVPESSIVVLPEGCFPSREVIANISRRRSLFVLFNEIPYYEDGCRYNAIIGMEKGNPIWRVRKHFLWKREKYWVDSPSKPEPMVEIRGMKTGVVICYELSKVAGFGKLFTIGKIIEEAKAELLLMPAVWAFNWKMPKWVIETCIKKIPSLKAFAFASSNLRNRQSYALVQNRNNGQKETKENNSWVSVEI